ncbi:hypothetical protein N7G274_005104 [Stereocaulon virgatum]|uniref:Uncharacterized protein n=1 Tax=Stereocaulon virgatum TaxID=373712 RepID=A0ABR4A7N5_9LECA
MGIPQAPLSKDGRTGGAVAGQESVKAELNEQQQMTASADNAGTSGGSGQDRKVHGGVEVGETKGKVIRRKWRHTCIRHKGQIDN